MPENPENAIRGTQNTPYQNRELLQMIATILHLQIYKCDIIPDSSESGLSKTAPLSKASLGRDIFG